MKRFIVFFIFFILSFSVYAAKLKWEKLAKGLEYTTLHPINGFRHGKLHVFRLDLKNYRLELTPLNRNQIAGDVKHWVQVKNALLGINGGFFDKKRKPLGLRVTQGKTEVPLKHISWWGVFFTRGTAAHIVPERYYVANRKIDFAIQSGPRLVINDQIPRLKSGVANRTALGITREGKIILLASENLPLSTHRLAVIMHTPESRGGLNCSNALNLDGGTSTQMYAKINQFRLNITGLRYISDAILVLPR